RLPPPCPPRPPRSSGTLGRLRSLCAAGHGLRDAARRGVTSRLRRHAGQPGAASAPPVRLLLTLAHAQDQGGRSCRAHGDGGGVPVL
ncbi:unnamed protein product, partial [Lampetra fluviatilis]